MDQFIQLLILASCGFVVGGLVGLTGVGGGSLMTPLLIVGMNVKATVAVGTDLLFAAITKASGAWTHARRDHVDWRLTLALAVGSVPAAAVTTAWVGRTAQVMSTTRTALGAVLVLTALAVLLRPHLMRNTPEVAAPPAHPRVYAVLIGLVLGVLVALTSVGAGALGVTALLLLFPTLPMIRIVGTDIAHAVPLTLVAGVGHAAFGNVDFLLLGGLLIGSIPGITLGSRFASRIPERALRYTLSAVLCVAAVKLLGM
jgi:uncharacterized protein